MSYDHDFDGQRLAYHPLEVAQWLKEGFTGGPLYTELELTTLCPCHCSFCGVDHIVNRRKDLLDTELAKRILGELAQAGNRSVLVSGHGEPLLHPDASQILGLAASLMSTALTTNGIFLDRFPLEFMDGLKWLRFSVNGCDPENYAAVHGVDKGIFERVLQNIYACVARKREKGLACVVGVQLVLLDENANKVVDLARLVREIGVDYFSVKPYSQHPLGSVRKTPDYSNIAHLEQALRNLEDGHFKVHFRMGSFERLGRPKAYRRCYGTHFMAYIDASGRVWACNVFAGDKRFFLGDMTQQPFGAIWHGPRHSEVMRFIEEEFDLAECRDVCRMDSCNRYLWRLKNPLDHDDFI